MAQYDRASAAPDDQARDYRAVAGRRPLHYRVRGMGAPGRVLHPRTGRCCWI
ncbi:MAG: hypothetical protein WKG07_23900 [Hymenobacter sp.]